MINHKEFMKNWRESHKEEIRLYNKKYKQEHKNEIKKEMVSWREQNKESIKAYSKNYYWEHRAIELEKNKKWAKENPDKINELQRKRYKIPFNLLKSKLRNEVGRKLRKEIIENRQVCEKCGSTENLEIHHKSYNSNKLDNLLLLCESCHRKEHK
jgi:5-methylcytosine-specific restriction endonuclease McrA